MTDDPQAAVDALKPASPRDVHRAVREEGDAELHRPARSLFFSGIGAGLAISASLVAEGMLDAHLPAGGAAPLIVALGYPIGFMLVILGRMQLFTESTMTAMLPLVHAPGWARLALTLRLWGLVLAANMLGAAVAAAAFALTPLAAPDLFEGMTHVARDALAPRGWEAFARAVPAGFLIAGLAWALPNARGQAVQVIAAVAYVVALGGFAHSVVGSVEAFLLLWRGLLAPGEALGGYLLPVVAGNLAGGAGLFAMLANAQVRAEGEAGS